VRIDRLVHRPTPTQCSQAIRPCLAWQWEQELADIRRDTALHESASHDYMAKGSKILELAQTAPVQFLTQNPAEQARLLKMVLSNCTFDRGTRSVAWVKPFDLLARGNETGDWLGGRESRSGLCACLRLFATCGEVSQSLPVAAEAALRSFAAFGGRLRPFRME
jgi:hypothetical protein